MSIRVETLRRFEIDLNIDGHNALGAVLRVTGGLRPFRLLPITANIGRGYTLPQFKANVMRIMDRIDEPQHVLLMLQEIDEADPAEEHEKLLRWAEPGTTLVGWGTREPIMVSPGIRVTHKRRTLLMEQGTKIGAPEGTGPRRDFVSCVAHVEGVRCGVGNQHPHRDLANEKVQLARRGGVRIARREVADLVERCDLTVWGGDVNDHNYPKLHPRERNVHTQRNDTLRLIVA